MLILGLGHRKRVGKDTAAAYLVKTYGATQLAFGDTLKKQARLLYPFLSHEQLWGDAKDAPDPRLGGQTPRNILLTLGHVTRESMGQDIYVRALKYQLQSLEEKANLVVISDVRTEHEVKFLSELPGAYLVRIERPQVATSTDLIDHDLDNWDGWDYEIENDGSLGFLYMQLEEAIGLFREHTHSS